LLSISPTLFLVYSLHFEEYPVVEEWEGMLVLVLLLIVLIELID